MPPSSQGGGTLTLRRGPRASFDCLFLACGLHANPRRRWNSAAAATISARSRRGRQPSTRSALPISATRRAGSPARRGPTRVANARPVTRSRARRKQIVRIAGAGLKRDHDVERLARQVDIVRLTALHPLFRDAPDGVLEVDLVPDCSEQFALPHHGEQDQLQTETQGRERRHQLQLAQHDANLGR